MNTINTLWRNFLTYALSFMLLSLNFTIDYQTKKFNISSSSAYAQTTTTQTDSGVSKGKSGTVKIDEAEGSFLFDSGVALLIFIAAAMVIYKLATTCAPIGYDIYGAALGAGIFLMGELMSIFSTKNELKAKTLAYKTRGEDGKIDDEQYEALLKEKEMMENISKEADKRSKFQSAAAVVFGASAVGALFMEAKNVTLAESCTATAGTSAFCSPAVIPAEKKRNMVEEFIESSVPKITKISSASAAIFAANKACVATAEAALATAQSACTVTAGTTCPAVAAAELELSKAVATESACTLMVKSKTATEAACMLSTNPLFGEVSTPASTGIYASLLEALIPNANAAGMMGLMSGIAGAVAGYYIGQSKYINSLITTPKHRAILWGALSAYGFMVSANTKKTSEAAKANAEKIDKILGLMDRSRTKTSVTSNVASAGGLGKLNLGNGFGSNEFGTTLPCSNGSTTDAAGKVVCKVAPFSTNSSFSGTGDLPTGLAPIFASAGNLINDSQGKSSASDAAASAIDTINGYQNAVTKGVEKAQTRLNNVLAKSGKAPINFKKEQDKLFSNMQNKVKNDLAKNGLTPSLALGRLGLGTVSDSAVPVKEASAVAVEEITPKGGKGISPANKEFEFNLSPEETLSAYNADLAANAEAAAEVGEIKDDIIKDKNESLFKVISIRYKKAYDRLLDEL